MPTMNKQELITNIQTIVRGNEDNVQETIENLRAATENLAQLSAGVKARPWSLVRIRQPKTARFRSNVSCCWLHQPIDVVQKIFVVRELDRNPSHSRRKMRPSKMCLISVPRRSKGFGNKPA